MGLLPLALLCIVAAVSHCQAKDVDELQELANNNGAFFTQSALRRMQDNELWGAERGDRSTDVIIINSSLKNLRLTKSACNKGGFSQDLAPENQLRVHSSTVFGMESSEDQEGIQCNIRYDSEGTAFVDMRIDNPIDGEPAVYANPSWDLRIIRDVGQGNHNQVVLTVTDK